MYQSGYATGELSLVGLARTIGSSDSVQTARDLLNRAPQHYLLGGARERGLRSVTYEDVVRAHGHGCDAIAAELGEASWPVEWGFLRWLADYSGVSELQGASRLPNWYRNMSSQSEGVPPPVIAHVIALREQCEWRIPVA